APRKRSGARTRVSPESRRKGADAFASGGSRLRPERRETQIQLSRRQNGNEVRRNWRNDLARTSNSRRGKCRRHRSPRDRDRLEKSLGVLATPSRNHQAQHKTFFAVTAFGKRRARLEYERANVLSLLSRTPLAQRLRRRRSRATTTTRRQI